MVVDTFTPPALPPGKEGTILVVDDFPENLSILCNILNENNYQVQAAINGELALEAAKHSNPDLILLDIRMPGMDGFEVCRRLKEDPETLEIPIIFITGLCNQSFLKRGFKTGAVDYITKPFKVEEILARVRNQIKIHHFQKSLIQKNKELEAANRIRDKLQNVIYHDLKGPLAPILSFPSLIAKNPQLTEKELKFLTSIETAGYRIKTLIDQLTAIQKSQQGLDVINLVPVDLIRQISLIVDATRGEMDRKEIRIDLQMDGSPFSPTDQFNIEGDQWLISSMLDNLIRNAIEASTRQQEIQVNIETTPPCTITIHNPTPVPSHLRTSFFEKDNSFGKESGIGLGTYVAKMVADYHQGRIEMQSDEEKGTTIIITLPITQAPLMTEDSPHQEKQGDQLYAN